MYIICSVKERLVYSEVETTGTYLLLWKKQTSTIWSQKKGHIKYVVKRKDKYTKKSNERTSSIHSQKERTSAICSRKQLVVDVREREEQGGGAGVLSEVQLPLYTVAQVSAWTVQKCIAQYSGNCCTVQLGREGGGKLPLSRAQHMREGESCIACMMLAITIIEARAQYILSWRTSLFCTGLNVPV